MIRTLSSAQTFLVKYLFSALWIVGFGAGLIPLFVKGSGFHDGSPSEKQWQWLVAWIAGSILIWWFCIRLKMVRMDNEALYISNYLVEIRVPLQDVVDISENRWVNSHPVTLKFRGKTRFGSSIVFMPKKRWFAFFSSHPVVNEIGVAVYRSKKK
ncbi:MAG TPA: hypothetical protein VIJ93_07065 [bacterium]